MKRLFLLLAIVCGYGVSLAQSDFVFDKDTLTISTHGDDKNFVYLWNNLTNLTTSDLTVNWNYVDIEPLPAGWLYNGFCDNITCFPPGEWSTGKVMTTAPFAKGTTCDFKLQMDIKLSGENTKRVFKFQAVSLSSGFTDTAYFVIEKTPLSIHVLPLDDKSVSIYPNPGDGTQVNIFVNKNLKAEKVRILNMLGKNVKEFGMEGELASCSIENLAQGIYQFQIIDADSRVITVRKYVKK